jgi:hypothetical protein
MAKNGSPARYWFPSKTYGWGWGLPTSWQGWVVLVVYTVLLGAGAFLVRPDEHPLGYIGYCGVLTIGLIGICYAKGEPPRWRWGK